MYKWLLNGKYIYLKNKKILLWKERDNIEDLAIYTSFTKATPFDIINNFKK